MCTHLRPYQSEWIKQELPSEKEKLRNIMEWRIPQMLERSYCRLTSYSGKQYVLKGGYRYISFDK
jgi:hypothetical protein